MEDSAMKIDCAPDPEEPDYIPLPSLLPVSVQVKTSFPL